MFYDSWKGNDAQLRRLYESIDRYHSGILTGEIAIRVDSHTSSMRDQSRNRQLSFIRANRVKSDLILKKGLREENFRTSNNTTPLHGRKDVVTVTILIPSKSPEVLKPQPPVRMEEEVVEDDGKIFARVEPGQEVETPVTSDPLSTSVSPGIRIYKGWYSGVNLGIPFFWGDFLSTAADKTYIGVTAGIYGGYQFNSWLGVSLSLDYSYNKTGHRDYASGFLLDRSGMTYYTQSSSAEARYDALYGKVNMFSVGLHADLNANRIFGKRAAAYPLRLIVSPAIYANTFSTGIYSKSDDRKYVESDLSQAVSLGVGGDVLVRYDLDSKFGVQVKGTGMWITENKFDNIRTVGKVRQNAMWGVSAGMVWRINAR